MLEREHPLRRALSGEIHARPYPEVAAPARLSFVALLSTEEDAARDTQALAQLCEWQGVAPLSASARHFTAEMGGFHLSWERHSEFCTCAFRADGPVDEPFVETAMQRISQQWRQNLHGQVVAAAHIALEDDSQPERDAARAAEMFSGNPLVSSLSMGDKARVWTDFRVPPPVGLDSRCWRPAAARPRTHPRWAGLQPPVGRDADTASAGSRLLTCRTALRLVLNPHGPRRVSP